MRSPGSINAELSVWYAARTALASAQSYSIGGRSVTKANLGEINSTIASLESELARASAEAGTPAASGFGCVQLLRGP